MSSIAKVLIVDDEPLIRWSVAETLEDAGFTVVEAGSGTDAIKQLSECDCGICVVLLDLKLPDSNDLGLLRRIRDLVPRCRVILMTAHGTPEVLAEARSLGAVGALSKPFDLTRIVGLVREAVAA
jgi:DNA-binding NtrC family response regulator